MSAKTILITGGAGFIGSHVVREFVLKYPEYHILNLDALTYAGNLSNLTDIEDKDNYEFIKGDIVDPNFINELFIKHEITLLHWRILPLSSPLNYIYQYMIDISSCIYH